MKQETLTLLIEAEKEEQQPKAVVPFIGTWEEAPEFCQDNEYIRTGYRINFHTIIQVLKSLFMIHNETVNIWSHLIAALVFILFLLVMIIYLSTSFSFPNVETLRENLGITFTWVFDKLKHTE